MCERVTRTAQSAPRRRPGLYVRVCPAVGTAGCTGAGPPVRVPSGPARAGGPAASCRSRCPLDAFGVEVLLAGPAAHGLLVRTSVGRHPHALHRHRFGPGPEAFPVQDDLVPGLGDVRSGRGGIPVAVRGRLTRDADFLPAPARSAAPLRGRRTSSTPPASPSTATWTSATRCSPTAGCPSRMRQVRLPVGSGDPSRRFVVSRVRVVRVRGFRRCRSLMPSGRCWRADCFAVRRAQALARRSRSVPGCAEVHSSMGCPVGCGSLRTRSAPDGAASSSGDRTARATPRGRVSPGRPANCPPRSCAARALLVRWSDPGVITTLKPLLNALPDVEDTALEAFGRTVDAITAPRLSWWARRRAARTAPRRGMPAPGPDPRTPPRRRRR